MINPATDKLISFKKACKLPWLTGRARRRLSLSTLYRWASGASRGAVLESIKMPDGRYTTESALKEFLRVRSDLLRDYHEDLVGRDGRQP